MEHFLINSSVCLFVLWLFYKLILEDTSFHQWKRYYLLGSIIISILIPFIVVETIVLPLEEIPLDNFNDLSASETATEEQMVTFNWFYIGVAIYFTGVVIMLWRFVNNLNSFKIKPEDTVTSYSIYQLILRKGITIPHSFFNRIFASASDYQKGMIPEAVLEHEKAHLDQKHSLDILLIEFLLVLFWFQPVLYIIRYSMKLNHEFLADRVVIDQGFSTSQYQELLLKHATSSYQQAMANTFQFPIIKKRFSIMKTNTSTTSGLLRSLALIPILTLLIISCGREETEFQEVEETIEKVEQTEEIEIIEVLDNLTSKDIEEYNFLARRHQEFIKKNGHVVLFNEDTKRMQLIFNSMNEKQRAENEPWPYINWENDIRAGELPPPPPPPAIPLQDQGYIKVDGSIYYYTLKEGEQAFYDRKGNIIDVKGKTVEYIKEEDLPPPPPPVPALDLE